jgi:hypothetical protein
MRWGDTRHPVFHSQVGPRSPDGLAYHVLEDDAGALEMPMVLQEAEPILVPIAGPGHALVGPLPPSAHEDTKRHVGLKRRLP